MKKLTIKFWTVLLAFTALAGTSVIAQTAADPAPVAPPGAPAALSAAELEKLAEPIALHPDPLIAVILPASVYPLEIVQAARFVKDTNNIAKVDQQDWDENIKAVAKFPTLIAKMDADLEWTTKLGQAFLDQPKELMDAIQSLRMKAQTAGTLRNSDQQVVVVTNSIVEKTVDQQVVVVTNTIVQIQPSNPEVVYVPSYPPTVYYPPPAYVYDPYAPLITFGAGMAVGAIIANNCDWHGGCVNHYNGGDININNNVNRNVNRDVDRDRSNTRNTSGGQKWQPDQNRMRNSGSSATREARGWTGSGSGAGATRASTQQAGRTGSSAASARPSTGSGNKLTPSGASSGRASGANAATRPSAGSSAARPSSGNASARPSAGNASTRSSAASTRSSPSSSSRSSAFGGVNSGGSAQNYSSRGSSSRSSSGFSGGGASRSGGASRGGGGRGGGGRR